MNFHDFLRSAFGLNQRGYNDDSDGVNRFKKPLGQDDVDDDEDDDFDELWHKFRQPFGFGFNIFSGDAMDIHKYFEKQMDDMLKSFQSMDSSAFGPEFNQLPEEPHSPEEHIRDRYLKPRFEEPNSAIIRKGDTDIDEKVLKGGMESLFEEDKKALQPVVPKTFGRSQTMKVIIGSDGRYEEHKSERTSDGFETVTVTRKLGDQTHSVVTKTDKSGQRERFEELINLDEGSLKDFDNKWTSPRSGRPDMPPLNPPQDDSIMGKFNPFKFFR